MAWQYINGERIQFPLSSEQAERLGWTRVKRYFGPVKELEVTEQWLKANVKDRAYFIGAFAVYFYRESDANWFKMRWL